MACKSWKIETVGDDGKERTRLSLLLERASNGQDGKPFTADDVKATIEFIREHSIPRYFDSVKDVDDITVTETLLA